MVKYCDICGKKMVKGKNCVSAWAMRCCIVGGNGKDRTKCQRIKDRQTSKAAREKNKEEGIKVNYRNEVADNNKEVDMRECLKCDVDEYGVAPKFLSLGPHHRICDDCSSTTPGISVKNLSRAGEVLEGVEFIFLITGQSPRKEESYGCKM